VFRGNFQQVVVTHPSAAVDNDWSGNYWDDYTGFDLDGDGIGDTPYSSYLYSERLWMDRDMARFFRGTPMLEMVDLMERLAPFSDPPLVLRDKKPRMDPEFSPGWD
jgi:nitrous oxidase accessory protein